MNAAVYEDEYEQTWRVLELDLWGNDEDGYEVNDQHDVGAITLMSEDYQDDQKVLEALVDAGYLEAEQDYSVDGDEYVLYITLESVPVLTLVRDQR